MGSAKTPKPRSSNSSGAPTRPVDGAGVTGRSFTGTWPWTSNKKPINSKANDRDIKNFKLLFLDMINGHYFIGSQTPPSLPQKLRRMWSDHMVVI